MCGVNALYYAVMVVIVLGGIEHWSVNCAAVAHVVLLLLLMTALLLSLILAQTQAAASLRHATVTITVLRFAMLPQAACSAGSPAVLDCCHMLKTALPIHLLAAQHRWL
jgi:hypothetical protein